MGEERKEEDMNKGEKRKTIKFRAQVKINYKD